MIEKPDLQSLVKWPMTWLEIQFFWIGHNPDFCIFIFDLELTQLSWHQMSKFPNFSGFGEFPKDRKVIPIYVQNSQELEKFPESSHTVFVGRGRGTKSPIYTCPSNLHATCLAQILKSHRFRLRFRDSNSTIGSKIFTRGEAYQKPGEEKNGTPAKYCQDPFQPNSGSNYVQPRLYRTMNLNLTSGFNFCWPNPEIKLMGTEQAGPPQNSGQFLISIFKGHSCY